MEPEKQENDFREQDERLFKQHCKTLQILNESTDDYLYIAKLQEGRFYFWGNLAGRYPLDPDPKDGYSIEEYAKIVYDHDEAALVADIRNLLAGKQDIHDMEYRLIDREGNQVWISCRGKVVYDDNGRRLFMMGRISDTVLLGKTDSLTGLFNSLKFIEDFDDALRQGREGTLLVLGVDNFKNVNKKYGRAHGNRILKNMAFMMEDCVDDKFRIYRLDGDHFAINFIGYRQEMVVSVYESIQMQTGEECTLSAGAVSYPLTDVHDANTIYMYAESALDRAKKAGKNQLLFFSVEDYTKQLYLIDLADEMRRSIQNNCEGFFLCYQPQISMYSMEVKGAEALLRYRSAYHGIVSPVVFISILEQTGMIVPVGNWVLREAMRQCREWRRTYPKFCMSVNLSYVQLQQKELSETIFELLDQMELPGDAIVLELTESMQLQDYTRFNQLFYQWGKRGIQVSIDDFGTGYSGLSYLKSLAIDEIKIDRSFISSIQLSAYNYRLLQNVLELAHSAQIRVCCEGVETIEELKTLEGLMPEILQGYYFSKPVTSDEFERLFLYDNQEQEEWKKTIRATSERPQADERQGWNGAPFTDPCRAVLDQFDEIVYVIDADTHELCYMNVAAKRFIGITDYEGKKCYQVRRQSDQPCPECNMRMLEMEKFTLSDSVYEMQGTRLLMKEKLIRWNGRVSRLAIGYDLSAMGQVRAGLEEKLTLIEYVIEAITQLTEYSDQKQMMDGYLRETCKCYKADRGYLFLHSEKERAWANLYEWCENEVESQQIKLLSLPESVTDPWLESFRKGLAVIVQDIDIYKDSDPETWKVFHMQNIRRLIIMPLLHDGVVFGFMGVDNPKRYALDETFFRRTAPFVTRMFEQRGTLTAQEELISEMTEALKEENIIRDMHIGMWIIEMDTETNNNRMYVDKIMSELLGAETAMSGEQYFHRWYDHIADGYREYVDDAVRDMMLSNQIVELEYPWRHPTLGEVPVRCVGRLSRVENGVYTYKGYHLITKDMVYKHLPKSEAMKRQYVRKEDFYQAILQETAAYAEVDLENGLLIHSGGLWKDYLQESRGRHLTFQELQDQYAHSAVAEEHYKGYCQFLNVDRIRQRYREGTPTVSEQLRYRTKEGYRWMELFVHAFCEQETGKMYALLYMKDIHDKKLRHLENERAATRDPLTNVLNRKSFEERAIRYMDEDARDGESCALLIFDIDNFKHYNDKYGHHTGDEILRVFVQILHETFRKTDYVGRFGGDEFVVFLKNYISREILSQRLEEFQKRLQSYGPQPIYCSIGIAVSGKEEFDYERCLSQADEALYICKNNGKNRFSFQKDFAEEP